MWAQDKRDKDSIGGLPENFNRCWKLDAIRRVRDRFPKRLCRRLKPARVGNKTLRRWPEGQHYPKIDLKARSTRTETGVDLFLSG